MENDKIKKILIVAQKKRFDWNLNIEECNSNE